MSSPRSSLVFAFLGVVCVVPVACSGGDSAGPGSGGSIGATGGKGTGASATGGTSGDGSGGSPGTPGTGGDAPQGTGGTPAGSGGAGAGTASGGDPGSGGVPSATGGGSVGGGGGRTSSGGNGGRTGTGGAGATGSGGAGGSSGPWCLPISAHPMGMDWGKALIASQGRAIPGLGWQYFNGLFLHGVYLTYKRTGDAALLTYVRNWADAHVNGVGSYATLDMMQPTIVLNDMYRETKDAKYGNAPRAVANRLETNYPKTSDGGFWHMSNLTGQLWGDGVFMDLPTYVAYGELFAHSKSVDVATDQLIIYDKHLVSGDLHKHNWTEGGDKQSCCVWCRAAGWYEMSILLVLDQTPPTHPNYAALVAIVQRLAKGVEATQDPATGRWWQVMDKPGETGNWLETSCTAMHSYFLSKASQKGYIDAAHYAPLAIKAFNGEMQQVSNPSNVQILNICPGTGVLASAAEYYARPKATNDEHGLGAFLMMYDQLTCH